MLLRILSRRYGLALLCILLPTLGTSCPSDGGLSPGTEVIVTSTYNGRASSTSIVNTQMPKITTTTTRGVGDLTFKVSSDGRPRSVVVGIDNNGADISTFDINYASMTVGVAVNLPAGSTAEGYTQTGTITAKELTFSSTGFHIVIEDTGAITYLSGSQAGQTWGGLTTSSYDGVIDGDALHYTESVISDQTVSIYGATVSATHTTFTVTGTLTKQ